MNEIEIQEKAELMKLEKIEKNALRILNLSYKLVLDKYELPERQWGKLLSSEGKTTLLILKQKYEK